MGVWVWVEMGVKGDEGLCSLRILLSENGSAHVGKHGV